MPRRHRRNVVTLMVRLNLHKILDLLINALLGLKGRERIAQVTMKPTIKIRDHLDDYCALFDLSAQDNKKRLITLKCSWHSTNTLQSVSSITLPIFIADSFGRGRSSGR